MRTFTRIGKRYNFFTTFTNIVRILNFHLYYSFLKIIIYDYHIFRKSLCFFTFLGTDFILQSETKCGTMSLRLRQSTTFRASVTPQASSCNSMSFLFRIVCVILFKNIKQSEIEIISVSALSICKQYFVFNK